MNKILAVTINLQDKQIKPTTEVQIVTADENYSGLDKVVVDGVTSAIDSNIKSENIKKDVEILGVTGTMESIENSNEIKLLKAIVEGEIYENPIIKNSIIKKGAFIVVNSSLGAEGFLKGHLSLPNANEIGYQSFSGQSFITSLNAPNLELIGSNAFYGCSRLTSVNAPRLKSIGGSSFYNCIALESIDLSNITQISSYAFYDTGLKQIEISQNITSIGQRAFYSQRTELITFKGDIPTLGLEALNFQEVFLDLRNVTKVYSSSTTPFVNYSGNNLRAIVPSNLYDDFMNSSTFSLVKNGGGIYKDGTEEGEVFVLEMARRKLLNEPYIFDFNEMFSNPKDLILLRKKSFYVDNNGKIDIFKKIINIPNTIETLEDYCFAIYSTNNNTTNQHVLDFISFENGSKIKSLPAYCFQNRKVLEKIENLPQIITIGDYCFDNCNKLYFDNIDFSNTTSIGNHTFRNCYKLINVDFPRVTSIGTYAFYYCQSLTSISISNVTSIGTYAFYGCSSCELFDFRGATQVPTLSSTNAFSSTPSTKKIVVPDSLYDTWITSTNWSSSTNGIVSSIIKASDYEASL